MRTSAQESVIITEEHVIYFDRKYIYVPTYNKKQE